MTSIGLLIALIGFCISYYIYSHSQKKKPLMCPRKAPCESVLSSPQATTFGFSNAVLGMVYYAFAFFILFCLYIGGRSTIAEVVLLLASGTGFGFSMYLIKIQKVVIKQWCVWCLGSAVTATVLFIISIILFF